MEMVYSYHRLRAGFDGELDEELDGVREYAAQKIEPHGYVWGGHFVDAPATRSKRLFSRPEGRKLYWRLSRGDCFLIPRQSTGFASVADFLDVARAAKRNGWHMVVADIRYVSWLPNADELLAMFELQADADHQRRVEGLAVAHETRRERGRAPNQYAGYGFKLTGPPGRRRVVADPEEQSVMATIAQLRRSGKSYAEIARELMLAGVVTRGGVEWSPSRVARALPMAEAMFKSN